MSARSLSEVSEAESEGLRPEIDDVGSRAPKPHGLFAQIQEDWDAHGRDYGRPGFHAVAVHRLGCWQEGIRAKLVRAPVNLVYRALSLVVRNIHGIAIPSSAHLGRRVVIEDAGGILVHDNAVIGDECVISHDVTLGCRGKESPNAAPRLGNRVSVGAGAKILGAVRVGDDARIADHAVVCADVGVRATAAGVPTRVRQP